jgi:hypothetical protein
MTAEVEMTADQKRALFEAYEKQRQKVASANTSLDIAVKNIAEQIGSGPFRWQGTEISIVKRGDRYSVRTKGQAVEEIV